MGEFLIDPFDTEQVDYRSISSEPSKSFTQVRVESGTVTAKIPKLNRSSRYEITTPLGTAGIRGTVVTVSVSPVAATFVVTEGMIQVTRDGQSYWVADGADQGEEGGETRTAKEGSAEQQVVVISTEDGYQPSQGQLQNLTQQGQQFSDTAGQSVPQNPFSGAPPQETAGSSAGTTGADGGGSDAAGGGDGGGGAPPLPGGFGGGGGGGSGTGGGGIYSN